jgi:hypothetical protein
MVGDKHLLSADEAIAKQDAAARMAVRLARFEAFGEAIDIARSFVTPLDEDGKGYPAHEAAAETAEAIAQRIEELRSAAKPRAQRLEGARNTGDTPPAEGAPPLMCIDNPTVPCSQAWKTHGCGAAGYECMSETDRAARKAALDHLAAQIDVGAEVRCTSHQSGDQCTREATRCVTWETDDGRKHEASMCATCFAGVRNMLLSGGMSPHDTTLPNERDPRIPGPDDTTMTAGRFHGLIKERVASIARLFAAAPIEKAQPCAHLRQLQADGFAPECADCHLTLDGRAARSSGAAHHVHVVEHVGRYAIMATGELVAECWDRGIADTIANAINAAQEKR